MLIALLTACSGFGGDKNNGGVGDDTGGSDGTDGSDGNAEVMTISLVLSSQYADLNGNITATVTVTAPDGSVVEEPYSLMSDASGGVSIDGDTITFSSEGAYTFTASLNSDTSISAMSSPVIVDENGPLVTLDSPLRGAFNAGTAVTISGTVTDNVAGVAGLTLNGSALTLDGSGHFSTSITADPGEQTLLFAATDGDMPANAADIIVGITAGDYQPVGTALNKALEVRLSEEALGGFAEAITGEFDADTLEATLIANNPIASVSVSCLTVDVNVTSFDYGSLTADLSPDTGKLTLDAVITDMVIGLNNVAYFCSTTPNPYAGIITADAVNIFADMTVTVPTPGDVDVEVTDSDVTFTNLILDVGGLEDLLDTFGVTLADLGLDIETLLGDAINDSIISELPAQLEAAIEAITFHEAFDFVGASVTLDALVSEVVLDPLGMTLRFDADATANSVKDDLPANPGSWLQGGGAPVYDSSTGMDLSLALDLFNRMLYAGWSAGAFDQDLSNEELALDPAAIGLIFPGATTLNLLIVPAMPPVVSPGTGDGLFDLDMVELYLVATGDVDGVEEVLTTASLHLHADLDATVDADGLISIAVENLAPTADVYAEDGSSTAAAESLEATLGSLATVLLADLFPGIELQLPALPGYTLEPTGLEVTGDAGTWMTVGGSLVVE